MRPHWMGTPDPSPSTSRHGTSLDRDPQPCPPPSTWDLSEHGSPSSPPLVTSSGHHGRPVQTCSLLDTPPLVPTAGGYWRLGQWKWVIRIPLECFLAVTASCRNISVQNDLFTGLPGHKMTVTFYKIKTNLLSNRWRGKMELVSSEYILTATHSCWQFISISTHM